MSGAREGTGGVLALFGGLLLLGMAFYSQCSQSTQVLEVGPFLEQVLDPEGMPEGWRVEACERVPDGRVLLRLQRLSEPAPSFQASPAEVAALAKIPAAPSKKGPKPWEHLQQRTGLEPVGALLAQHPAKTSMDRRKKLFRGLDYKGIEQVSAKGEALPLDAGRVPWGPYEVPWVHLRHFERVDGRATFHDTLRIDLSSGPNALILHLAYAPRARASQLDLAPFLAAWGPPMGEPGAN